MLPRFFVPAAEGADVPEQGRRPLSHAVASLYAEGPHATPGEWVIVADDRGVLYRARPGRRDLLPPLLQNELAQAELLREPASIDIASVSLMAVTQVVPAPDVAGLNDPIFLEGTLLGPLPSEAPIALRGRLTVTRGDLLEGIVRGASSVFPVTGPGVLPARWHTWLLPGADEAEIRAGRGLVLAVPISVAELELGLAGNDDAVHRILGEVLAQLRDDARASQATSPLAALEVPGEKKKRSLVSKLFVVPKEDDASLEARLRVARQALDLLAGWPTPRARAVAERLRIDTAVWTAAGPAGLWPLSSALEIEGDALVLRKSWRQRAPLALTIAIDPSFSAWNAGPLELEVELLDGKGTIDLDLDDAARAGAIRLGGTGTWRTVTLAAPGLPRQHGLRVLFEPEAGEIVRVRRVALRPAGARPRKRPPPAPLPPTSERPTPITPPIVERAAPPPPPRVEIAPASARVALFDPRQPTGWVHDADRVAEGAARRGFVTATAEPIAAWLRDRTAKDAAPGSVCLLVGQAPPSIVPLLRPYLDAGGRVVWIGDSPFHPDEASILDLGAMGPPIDEPPILTDDGRVWGLTVADAAKRTYSTKDVTTVLSRAGGRYAASWHKCFAPAHPHSGFVRVRGGVFRGKDERLVDDLFRVALHRLG